MTVSCCHLFYLAGSIASERPAPPVSLLPVAYVLDRVDVEPTGEAFNSIMHLEMRKIKKPFNPFINAGAITVTSLLNGKNSSEKLEALFELFTKILGYRPMNNFFIHFVTADTN